VSGPPRSLLANVELWYGLLKGWTDLRHQERLRVKILSTYAVMAGLLKRADEIGFEESLDLVVFLFVFSRQLLVRDQIISHHPASGS
jgi:hypothetical protein